MNALVAVLALSSAFLLVDAQPEHVGGNKYAVVYTNVDVTYAQATSSCKQLHGASGSLFIVNSAANSAWLGQRINVEKDNYSGSSKFWVGLEAKSPSGPLVWVDGTPYNPSHPEIVVADGYEDPEKIYAWAVPDSGSKIKYEFLTHDDNAEAYICQFYN